MKQQTPKEKAIIYLNSKVRKHITHSENCDCNWFKADDIYKALDIALQEANKEIEELKRINNNLIDSAERLLNNKTIDQVNVIEILQSIEIKRAIQEKNNWKRSYEMCCDMNGRLNKQLQEQAENIFNDIEKYYDVTEVYDCEKNNRFENVKNKYLKSKSKESEEK
jgi:hypothetical protein